VTYQVRICVAAVVMSLGASSVAIAQGVAPLRLGVAGLAPSAPLSGPHSWLLQPLRLRPPVASAALPLCKMPVAAADLSRAEQMPGSHAPTHVGTEAFGCTNPLGPSAGTSALRLTP
jgi:hypothetical protein